MASFVLVHGAWAGGWCWQRVAPVLRAQGHEVHAVTLTGVGDRAHLLNSDIHLETHIQDVVSTLDAEELDRVVLVVHSYAGMIGTAIADRCPARLRHLVYVDAVVPNPGESWSSTHSSATRSARIAAAHAQPDFSFPPPDPSVFGLTQDDHAWYQRRQTPHPARPYTDTLSFNPQRVALVPRTFIDCTHPALGTIDVIRRRVRDPRFWEGAWTPGAQLHEIKTGHAPMISTPAQLAAVLLHVLDR